MRYAYVTYRINAHDIAKTALASNVVNYHAG